MSTISASTTSTTAYQVTADTTGTLVLKTGASPTTAVTIDGSQNVGIGTSSPSSKLDVAGANALVKSNATSGYAGFYANAATGNQAYNFFAVNGTEVARIGSDATNTLFFSTGSSGTGRMFIDSSGNVGIGTSSPLAKMHVYTGSITDTSLFVNNAYVGSTGGVQITQKSTGEGQLFTFNAQPLLLGTNNTERARIDSSGNFLLAVTSDTNVPTTGVTLRNSAGTIGNIGVGHASGVTAGNPFVSFAYNGGGIGSITQNGTTGVLYNLTSDYRLKNDPQPLTNAKDFVMALQPKTWDWWDGSGKGVGFIAHEFMEVAKYSGHGEKDAVDDDGNPVYQSIQPSSSEVMANLVALLQEQQAIIETLTNRIQALENK